MSPTVQHRIDDEWEDAEAFIGDRFLSKDTDGNTVVTQGENSTKVRSYPRRIQLPDCIPTQCLARDLSRLRLSDCVCFFAWFRVDSCFGAMHREVSSSGSRLVREDIAALGLSLPRSRSVLL